MGQILDSYTSVTFIPYNKYGESFFFHFGHNTWPPVIILSVSLRISASEEIYSDANGPVICTECSNVLEICNVMYV